METIKVKETYYKGYRFRSRLEARWAVFFDALGVEYEYEPEGFQLPDGSCYLPDFKVRCYGTRGLSSYYLCEKCAHCTNKGTCGDMANWDSNPFCKHYYSGSKPDFIKDRSECGGGQDRTEIAECSMFKREFFDLYIEVKGKMTPNDAEKIKSFAGIEVLRGDYIETISIKNPILVVGNIPPSGKSFDSEAVHAYEKMDGCDIYPFNYQLIDGDYFAAYPAAHDGMFYLWGDDSNYIEREDIEDVERAYNCARSARFEHGEKPRI